MTCLPIAKAESGDDRSEAIVVSFHRQWLAPLTQGLVRSIIRKRVPRLSPVSRLYAYVASPVASIVGCFDVSGIESGLRRSQAYSQARDLCLTKQEIDEYWAAGENGIGIYHLGRGEMFRKRLPLREIRKSLVFHPPQSFLFLSVDGERILRELASSGE